MDTRAKVLLLFFLGGWASPARPFQFVVLGDRTGEAQPGVYEQVWREIRALSPAFVLSVGDTIQGGNDSTAEQEWREAERIATPAWWRKLYLAAGNHDVWSPASEQLFRKHAGHSLHYSFDYEQAHFTVLDNSRTEILPPDEMRFLEEDLRRNASQPVKFIISHRPSWIIPAMLHNPDFPLQQLARNYKVQFVVGGHIHEMLQMKLDGISYLSMGSAGGHLRGAKKYEDGWFFGYALITVDGNSIRFEMKELNRPLGEGRTTSSSDWGTAGLAKKVP